MARRIGTGAVGLCALLGLACGGSGAREGDEGIDFLVVAPHPDDESLGCGGILAQAWAQGRRAKVVVLTNGDGNAVTAAALSGRPKEALAQDDYLAVARLRQTQARRALAELGGKPDDLVFLGYPDTGLERLHAERSAVWTQPLTGRSETYGPVQSDFHSSAHGTAAPYTYASLRSDLESLLQRLRPRRIYVTHETDRHPDHRAAFAFVRDAARAVGHRGELHAYVIHAGVDHPPGPDCVRLSEEALQAKTRALHAYLTGFPSEAGEVVARKRAQFLSFARAEEAFWPVPLD